MRIAVYASSSPRVGNEYLQAAHTLGTEMAARGHALIYGGANIGLMGEVARAVRGGGGHVTGVIPQRLTEYDIVFEEADELLITETMAERKGLMAHHAQGFVALPGGFGTLEELVEVITLKQLEYLQGPIVLLNTAGFYDGLLDYFEHLYRLEFAMPVYRQLYYVARDPTDTLDYIEGYRDTPMPPKWF